MSRLFGHDVAIAALRETFDSGRLHHAWLLAGPEGVGKARFADMAALRFLAEGTGPPVDAPGLEVPETHPVAALFAAGSHPDMVRLERETREGGTSLARNISVAQVRRLIRLFSVTPSLSPRRVVIIDSIDDMERSAANALLKHLEEPPPDTLFLLVSHAPQGLLPTIRSRCRLLRFAPLARDAMTSAIRQALPDAAPDEVEALADAGAGAPGRAIAFRGLDIAALEAEMRALAADGDPTNRRRSALAQSLGARSAQPRYEAFLARAPSVIAAIARDRKGEALSRAIAAWGRSTDLAAAARRLSLDPQSITFELASLIAGLGRDEDEPPGPRRAS